MLFIFIHATVPGMIALLVSGFLGSSFIPSMNLLYYVCEYNMKTTRGHSYGNDLTPSAFEMVPIHTNSDNGWYWGVINCEAPTGMSG